MKVAQYKRAARVALLLLLLVATGSACSESTIDAPTHLHYFGFALTDSGVDDPGDGIKKTNYLDEVDEFVNLVDMDLTSFDSITDRVDLLSEENNAVLIHLGSLFVEAVPDPSTPTGVRYALLDDYASRWADWRAQNVDLDLSKVAAFNLPDEPHWNGMDPAELSLVARTVDADFPDVPILLIEAGPAVDGMEIDPAIDWVGFDEYGTLDPVADPDYRATLSRLKELRTQDQRIVIMLESQWLPSYQEAGYDQTALAEMAKSYYRLALEEEDAVAILCYLLPGGFDSPDQLGFRDLEPAVQETIRQIGLEVIGGERP